MNSFTYSEWIQNAGEKSNFNSNQMASQKLENFSRKSIALGKVKNAVRTQVANPVNDYELFCYSDYFFLYVMHVLFN